MITIILVYIRHEVRSYTIKVQHLGEGHDNGDNVNTHKTGAIVGVVL